MPKTPPKTIEFGKEPWNGTPKTLPFDISLDEGMGALRSSQDRLDLLRQEATQAERMAKEAEAPSTLAKEAIGGDRTVGVLKGLGQSALDLAKTVYEGARTSFSPGIAGVSMLPESLQPPTAKESPLFQKAEEFLAPKGETQEKYKTAEQLAELLVPVAGIAAKGVTKAPKIAQKLEEFSLRLTPAQKRDFGVKVDKVTRYLLDKNILGNPQTRLAKVENIYAQTEQKLQKFLETNNTARGIFVPKEVYINTLKGLKNRFRNSRDYDVIVKQIDDAIANVNTIFKRSRIPVARFNEYKRSIYDTAFNKAGTKVLDDVEFAIGDSAKDLLEKSLRGLKLDGKDFASFNDEYGTIINARTLLKAAESRDQVGILGKIISTVIGGGAGAALGGGFVGSGVGMLAAQQMAPVIAGTAARSYAAETLDLIGKLAPSAQKALGTLLLGGGALTLPDLEKALSGQSEEPTEEPLQGKE